MCFSSVCLAHKVTPFLPWRWQHLHACTISSSSVGKSIMILSVAVVRFTWPEKNWDLVHLMAAELHTAFSCVKLALCVVAKLCTCHSLILYCPRKCAMSGWFPPLFVKYFWSRLDSCHVIRLHFYYLLCRFTVFFTCSSSFLWIKKNTT